MLTARSHDERIAAARRRLIEESQMWLSTGGRTGPHLIPVSFVVDDSAVMTATGESSKTVRNLRERDRARLAIGGTSDVVMIDAVVDRFITSEAVAADVADRYAAVSHDPRQMPGYIYVRLQPRRIQVWNGFHEFGGRTVMRDGRWLAQPVD